MSNKQSMALYRKYRGLSFDDIIGQEHITSVLRKAVQNGRISHAYLFTGPRGVGKTSVARILAHAINDTEYKHEDNHIDIIEIDAASNRRIDEIRDLREKSHITPVSAKYKVYIIDEVHMLTKEAFNALLKTLEEPPAHVVFILATTEVHKLPATIISRTQRHTFKPIVGKTAVAQLAKIAQQEKINISDEALELIAEYGDGSFRDAISLLDQLAGGDKIDAGTVRDLLGLVEQQELRDLLEATINGDHPAIVSKLGELEHKGVQPALLSNQLLAKLRDHASYYDNLKLATALLEVPTYAQARLKLELVLLGAKSPSTVTPSPVKSTEPKPVAPAAAKPKEVRQKVTEPTTDNHSEASKNMDTPAPKAASTGSPTETSWADAIKEVKKSNNAIASILRAEPPRIENNHVTIYVKFDFHKKKLADTAVVEMIRSGMEAALGGVVEYEVEVRQNQVQTEPENQNDNQDELAESIISTFGGGERVNL